jgi:hypothetical protein
VLFKSREVIDAKSTGGNYAQRTESAREGAMQRAALIGLNFQLSQLTWKGAEPLRCFQLLAGRDVVMRGLMRRVSGRKFYLVKIKVYYAVVAIYVFTLV